MIAAAPEAAELEVDAETSDEVSAISDAEDVATDESDATEQSPRELSLADEEEIQKEIVSVKFYIENDYNELAEKALSALVDEYGDRPEFAELRNRIGAELPEPVTPASNTMP